MAGTVSSDEWVVDASAPDAPSARDRGLVPPSTSLPALVLGELIAMVDEGRTPLVAYKGMPGAKAIRARSLVALDRRHIGGAVGLMFEDGDARQPIVTGFLQGAPGWPLAEQPTQVEVDADGDRMVINAGRRLVLRCGKASITLTEDGRVEVRGETILTQAVAANRVRGGSVELN